MVDNISNFAYSTVFLAPFPPNAGTSLTVQAGDATRFPSAPFNIVVWPSGEQPLSFNAEIMRVVSINNNTFTVLRAQENTTVKPVAVGYQVAQNITAGLLEEIISNSVENYLSINGGTISGNLTVVSGLTVNGTTTLNSLSVTSEIDAGNLTVGGNLTVASGLSSSSFVDPITYGADPTGRTDSTAAIQAAIFSGIPVRFSPGIYVVSSPLYLPSGAKLEGTGMNLNAIYGPHPLPKETAAIYYANVSYNSTTGSTTYSAPGVGPLFVIHPANQNITIKDIVLYGGYTTSTDNYAIYAVDQPGGSIVRNYSTSQPWQAYNAADWIKSPPSVVTGPLSAGATTITGLSPSDPTFLQPGMSVSLYSNSPYVYEEVTVKSYSSGTLTLTQPIKNKYTSSSTTLTVYLPNMNLRLENVAANYFSGDATIYLGHNRGENRLNHVNIYGAGISTAGNNPNACGIVWNCSDTLIENPLVGACALHGIVLNDSLTAVTGGDIWGCGGNGIYILGGSKCTIGNRTEFDTHKKEAIYIDYGTATINQSAAGPGAYFGSLNGSFGCTDVTIEPGVSFSNNCTSFSGTNGAITSNIASDPSWTGKLNVLGTIVAGNYQGLGGVQYHVYVGNNAVSLNYTDNLPVSQPTTAPTYSVVSANGNTITLSGSTSGIVPYVPLTIGSEKKIVDTSYVLNSTTVPLTTTLTGTYSNTTMSAAVGLPYFNGAVYYSGYSPYGIANTGTGSLTKAGSPNVKINSDDSNVLWYRQISNGNTYTPAIKLQSSTVNSDQLMIQSYDSTSPTAYSSALYTQSIRLGTSNGYDTNLVRTASGTLTVQNNLIVTSGLTVSGYSTALGGFYYSTSNKSAAGTSQSTATPINTQYTIVISGTTATSNGQTGQAAVVLPNIAYLGQTILIDNSTSNWLLVYPYSTQKIDSAGPSNPVWLAPSAYWEGVAETTGVTGSWASFVPSFNSDSSNSINIVYTNGQIQYGINPVIQATSLTVSGTTTLNSLSVANEVDTGNLTVGGNLNVSGTITSIDPMAYGNPNVGETFSRYIATVPNTVSGTVMRFGGVYLTAGQVVNNITFATTSVASSGLTSSWGGIFTTSGTTTSMHLLAATSGQVNPTYAASSIITTALSGTFTVPSNGIYLVGFAFFGTTPPGWAGTGNTGNALLGSQFPVIMAQTSVSGYPTPPAIGTSFSVGGSSYAPWFALT